MLFCQKNYTFITLDLKAESFLKIIGNNIITGLIGKYLDRLLVKPDRRKCLIKSELSFTTIKNETTDSYSGILGCLARNCAQFYFNPEVKYIEENSWLTYSDSIVYADNFHILEDLSNIEVDKKLTDLLDSIKFEKNFLIYFFISLISLLIILLFLIKNQMKTKFYSAFILSYYFFNKYYKFKSRSISRLKLFYIIYIWFLITCISNLIKTEKVVVDTSNLIKNEEDIFRTKKTCCWFRGFSEHLIASSYPKSNILRKIYETKSFINKNDIHYDESTKKCLLHSHMTHNSIINFATKFIIIKKAYAFLLMKFFTQFKTNIVIWLSEKEIYSTNLFFYMRNEKEIKQHFNDLIINYNEAGLFNNLFNSIKVDDSFRYDNILYNSIDYYIEMNSRFDDLKLQNFELIYLIYFLICLSICFIYFLNCLIKLFKKLLNLQ